MAVGLWVTTAAVLGMVAESRCVAGRVGFLEPAASPLLKKLPRRVFARLRQQGFFLFLAAPLEGRLEGCLVPAEGRVLVEHRRGTRLRRQQLVLRLLTQNIVKRQERSATLEYFDY